LILTADKRVMETLSPSSKRYTSRHTGARPPTYLLEPCTTDILIDESKHVLIIDDDPFFRSLLKVMLAQTGLPIAEILEAEESRTALAICKEEPVDLVFCDLNLPKLWSKNGVGVVTDIRKIRPDLAVYVVTADNTAEVIQEVYSSGATGHILKPMNLRILRRILTTTFSSGLAAPPDRMGTQSYFS
jgi:DNA-binding NarL/FixJ family response regulator